MADMPGPSAAGPAAAASRHNLHAPVGCCAPGDQNPAPAHGVTEAGQVARDWAQIVTVIPGLAAPARCPACGAGQAWSAWLMTGTRRDGTALQTSGVIIFGVRGGVPPGLAPCPDAAAAALDPRQAGQWSLRREGPDWVLVAGPERARLRDSHGMHHLHALLAAPGREIPALDLAAGGGPGLAATRAGPLLDPTAWDAYRRRIRQLDSDLAAADRAGDPAAAERAHAEHQALIGELRRATGLGGRPRRAPAQAERARVNVTRTLRAAINAITAAAPIAGAHLQSAIRTGTACRYQPTLGGPARWHT